MRKMKKVMAAMLAATMALSMGMIAFGMQGTNPTGFTKKYTTVGEGAENPADTFVFSFTFDHMEHTSKGTVAPTIDNASVSFNKGQANSSGVELPVSLDLSNAGWTSQGIYYYKVKEVIPTTKTAGVSYDENKEGILKVTVAHDGDSDKYTAFVTLTLNDENNNGQTDSKVAGFENTYSSGLLKIKKTLAGNMADATQYFKIKVVFTSPEDGSAVKSEIKYTGGSGDHLVNAAVAVAANTTGWTGDAEPVEFELKGGDTMTFTNIPAGVKYTVSEIDYSEDALIEENKLGYETSYTNNKNTGSIVANNEDLVEVVNTKGVTVDTGITLDNAPYILVLVIAVLGMFGFVFKKRSSEF